MKFLQLPKELNGLSDRVLSLWFPTRKSSHTGADKEHGEDRALKEAWEGRGPTEWRCDLAWGRDPDNHTQHEHRFIYLFIYCYYCSYWDIGQRCQCQNYLRTEENMSASKGRRSPLDANHRHVINLSIMPPITPKFPFGPRHGIARDYIEKYILAHHFSHYYNHRCSRTMSDLAHVINPSFIAYW